MSCYYHEWKRLSVITGGFELMCVKCRIRARESIDQDLLRETGELKTVKIIGWVSNYQ